MGIRWHPSAYRRGSVTDAAAFPNEDLLPLVRDLLPDEADRLSIVGEADSRIVAYVIVTKYSLCGKPTSAALLGPQAATPARQGRGIGSASVRAGLGQLKGGDVRFVFVWGDPAFLRTPGISAGILDQAAVPFASRVRWR